MLRIVTDEERLLSHSTPRSSRASAAPAGLSARDGPRHSVFVHCASLGGPVAADQLSDAKAKAAQIEAEITSTGQQIDALDQQYEGAVAQKAAIDQQISSTQAQIAQTQHAVSGDQSVLRKAAVDAYMNDGTVANEDPLFSGNQTSNDDASEYDNVAEGDLGTAVANLHTAQNQLGAQETTPSLPGRPSAGGGDQGAERPAAGPVRGSPAAGRPQPGQRPDHNPDQAAAGGSGGSGPGGGQRQAGGCRGGGQGGPAATATATAASGGVTRVTDPPPPPSSGGAGTRAVAAAETQIGVPYVWGGESPGVGFDCSGLTAWAWGQAGVPLPHYSGDQMADSTPVPISDLEPGDLLFYGAGGSQHVAMYVGGGPDRVRSPKFHP